MTTFKTLSLTVLLVLPAAAATAQSCSKVAYTTPNPTIKNLVASVNCLVSTEKVKEARGEASKARLSVDSFPIIGPQHTRNYRKVLLAILSVPAGNEIRTALVNPENPQAVVAGTAGAECKVKVNSDNTVDGQCNLTGGTLYVVYQN